MPAARGIADRHRSFDVSAPAIKGFTYNFARPIPVRDLHMAYRASRKQIYSATLAAVKFMIVQLAAPPSQVKA